MARGKTAGRYTPGRDAQQEDDSDRWLSTYADMITLLMAFFVMLYAMSQVDAEKFALFVKGLEAPFGNPAASELLDGGDGLMDAPAAAPPLTAPDPVALHDPADPLGEVESELDTLLVDTGLADVVEVSREARGLVIDIMTDDLLFATGSTVIDEAGADLLVRIAAILVDLPNPVLVEGHTDDVPITRTGYTNWNLSTDRAVAVVDVLTGRAAFDPHRLGAVGYGEFRPRGPNDGPTARARNRRVAIVVLDQGGPA